MPFPCRSLPTLLVATVLLAAPAVAQENEPTYLFVQTAAQATYADGTLTLTGLGPVTVFFSDRPERDVGYLTYAEFLEAWAKAADSFAGDPPNASLTYRDGTEPAIAVIELGDPRQAEDSLSYGVRMLEGVIPESFGPISLFIDAGGLMQLVAYGAQ